MSSEFCLKVSKKLCLDPKKKFSKEIKMGIENVKFNIEYKTIWKRQKSFPRKSYILKT